MKLKYWIKRLSWVAGCATAMSLCPAENPWVRGVGFLVLGFVVVPVADMLFPRPKPMREPVKLDRIYGRDSREMIERAKANWARPDKVQHIIEKHGLENENERPYPSRPGRRESR